MKRLVLPLIGIMILITLGAAVAVNAGSQTLNDEKRVAEPVRSDPGVELEKGIRAEEKSDPKGSERVFLEPIKEGADDSSVGFSYGGVFRVRAGSTGR